MSVILLLLAVFSFNSNLFSAIKGSETAMSVEPLYTFLAADNDNTLLGFGWFKNGFSLEDSSTTCTFDSVYPISGIVNMNGGSLYLKRDLLFNNQTILQGLGAVYAQSHVIDLAVGITGLPSNTSLFDSVKLFFNEDLQITSTITFQGNCLLHGNGNSLRLGKEGHIVVASGATVDFRDMRIEGIKEGNIRCVDDTGSLVLDQILWLQDADYTFTLGSISFVDEVAIMGGFDFLYASKMTSTIEKASHLNVTDNTIFSIGRYMESSSDPLYMVDRSSTLHFQDCNLNVIPQGLTLTRGTLSFDGNVDIDVNSTTTANGIMTGTGVPADDLLLFFAPSAAVNLVKGHTVFNNTDPNLMQAASKSSKIIRGELNYFYGAKGFNFPEMTVELTSNLVPPMQVATGEILTYNNSSVVLPSVEFDMSSTQLNAFTYCLKGNNGIFFSKGSLPLYLTVEGDGNTLLGNGSILGPITLNDTMARLNCDITGMISSPLILNGGIFTLGGNLKLGKNANIIGPGEVDIASYVLNFGEGTYEANNPLLFDAADGRIEFNGLLNLSTTWTFGGTKCVLEGNRSTLDLKTGGEIVVEDGSWLVIRNARILGLKDQKIRCLGNDAKVTFVNDQILLDNNYTFSLGSFQIIKNVDILGSYNFIYDSSRTSSINIHSKLSFGNFSKLVVGRNSSTTGIEPLYFEGGTSVLSFNNATMEVNSNGMILSRGRVICKRDFQIDIKSTSTANGLRLGNSDIGEGFEFEMYPGSTVRYLGGHLQYDVDSTFGRGIVSHSPTAQIIRYIGSDFYITQDLELANLTVDAEVGTVLRLANGVSMTYKDATIIAPLGEFSVTGSRYDTVTTLLSGNQYLFVSKGTFPAVVLAMGTGNTIYGDGTMGGYILLAGSTTDLRWNLTGSLLHSMIMNGGKVSLSCDLKCGPGVILAGTGSVSLGDNSFILGPSDLMWPSDTYWDGASGFIKMNADMALSSKWTFSGDCTIDGNGRILDLGTTGQILVEKGSQLRLKNLAVKNVSTDNVCCLNNDAKIIFENTSLMMDNNYTFSVGSFSVDKKFRIVGGHTFAYQTIKTSTIMKNSHLHLDDKVTFSYDPIFVASKDLLEFSDSSSELGLHGATLHTTMTGLNLKKGTLIVHQDSNILSETLELEGEVLVDEGITFGDSSVENSFSLVLSAGSTLNLLDGTLVYSSVGENDWKSTNMLSTFNVSSTARLMVNETLNIGAGRLIFHEDALFNVVSGKSVIGSVFTVE